MKTILYTIIFLSFSINLSAQNTKLIVGKWVFSKAINKGIDEAGMEFLQTEVIGKWRFEFLANKKYSTYMMGEKTIGKWALHSNMLTLYGIEGGPMNLKILHYSKNELVLKLGLGEFVLIRQN